MRALLPLLLATLALCCAAPARAELLGLGAASQREWGQFELIAEAGWPTVGAGLRWGTWRGGHHALSVSFQWRSLTVAPAFSIVQPVHRGQGVTVAVPFHLELLFQPGGTGLGPQLGLRFTPGLDACIGLGARRRSCLELGLRVPLGATFLHRFQPQVGVEGQLGWTAHLSRHISLGLRARGGTRWTLREGPAAPQLQAGFSLTSWLPTREDRRRLEEDERRRERVRRLPEGRPRRLP